MMPACTGSDRDFVDAAAPNAGKAGNRHRQACVPADARRRENRTRRGNSSSGQAWWRVHRRASGVVEQECQAGPAYVAPGDSHPGKTPVQRRQDAVAGASRSRHLQVRTRPAPAGYAPQNPASLGRPTAPAQTQVHGTARRGHCRAPVLGIRTSRWDGPRTTCHCDRTIDVLVFERAEQFSDIQSKPFIANASP